jgi:hypothetical protein
MTIVDTRRPTSSTATASRWSADLLQEALALQADGVDIISSTNRPSTFMKDAAEVGCAGAERAGAQAYFTRVHICYGYGIKVTTTERNLGDGMALVRKRCTGANSSIQQVSWRVNGHVPRTIGAAGR